MMRLIFFASSDPAAVPKPIWSAFHFAQAAARAGLEAEVRLAGDAVTVARQDGWADTEPGADLREKIAAGATLGYTISMCPNSSRARGISEAQIEQFGAVPRPLGDILTETAAGRCNLVYLG